MADVNIRWDTDGNRIITYLGKDFIIGKVKIKEEVI